MNIRNGIPIADYAPRTPHNQLWKAEPNPFTRYIEMAMIVDGHEASVIMPYKRKWVNKYLKEGWSIVKEWQRSVDNECNNA